MKKIFYSVLFLGLLFSFTLAEDKSTSTNTKELSIDGYKVTFKILPGKVFLEKVKKMDKELAKGEEAMLKMDKTMTHHFFVTITDENTKKEITDATVKVKVISPKKEDQIKSTMYMSNHFCHYYKMAEKGKYEVLVVFKIKDKVHKGGFYWEI